MMSVVGFCGCAVVKRTSLTMVSATPKETMFPVLSQIEGVNWEGKCRYVNGDLESADFLLKGGSRYELQDDGTCTMTSFLVFPNGQTRQVQMKGSKGSNLNRPSMRLDSTSEGGGPIYMVLTELPPDTVLFNEVDKETGNIIMTASLSIVNDGEELVQVSHEVGVEASNQKSNERFPVIEGHQVWRLKKASSFD